MIYCLGLHWIRVADLCSLRVTFVPVCKRALKCPEIRSEEVQQSWDEAGLEECKNMTYHKV